MFTLFLIWSSSFVFIWIRMFSQQKSSDLEIMKAKMSELEFFIGYPQLVLPIILIYTFLIAPYIAVRAVVKDIVRLLSKNQNS